MAKCHLLLQDKEKFLQAAELIQSILEKFKEEELSLNISTSESPTGDPLYKYEVLFSKAALDIYNEKFQQAYLMLKSLYANPEVTTNDSHSFFNRNLERTAELLKALEMLVPPIQMHQQSHTFPKELLTLLGQKVHLLFSKKEDLDLSEKKRFKTFVIANKDTLNFILKDYPVDSTIVQTMIEL